MSTDEQNEHLRQTLGYYLQQRQRLIEQQLQPLNITIRQIQIALGEASEEFDFPLLGSINATAERKPAGNGTRSDIRADEFFGMSLGDAARAYLSKVGHAVELNEIVTALSKGGRPVGGKDPGRTLYISLIRNTKDFVKIPNGHIGLRSMYPDLRSSAKPAKQKPEPKSVKSKPGAKYAKVPRKSSNQPNHASAPKAKPAVAQKTSLPIKATIRDILSGGKRLTGESIVQQVQDGLGPSAQKFLVFGILKNRKEFDLIGDQYVLIK